MHIKKIIPMLLVSACILTACGNSSSEFYETDTPDGYVRVLAQESKASFLVPQTLIDNAQEIVQFTDDCDYQSTYLVQNDDYYIICNGSFIYAVVKAKGSLPATVEEYAAMFEEAGLRINSGDINGEMAETKNVIKIKADDVPCMALLSDEYYNDFVGDIGIVKGTDTCYGIYFGALAGATITDNVSSIMDTIIKSLILDEDADAAPEVEKTVPLPLPGIVCPYRNSYGVLSEMEVILSELETGDIAKSKIINDLPYTYYDSIPALETGSEWYYGELTGNKPMKGMLALHYLVDGNFESAGRVYTLYTKDNVLKFFFQAPKDSQCSLLVGESGQEAVIIPFDNVYVLEQKVDEVPETEFSLNVVQSEVENYQSAFEIETELETEFIEAETSELQEVETETENNGLQEAGTEAENNGLQETERGED